METNNFSVIFFFFFPISLEKDIWISKRQVQKSCERPSNIIIFKSVSAQNTFVKGNFIQNPNADNGELK